MGFTEPEKAWLACAIDTEGHIELSPRKGTHTLFRQVTVANTHIGFLEKFKTLVEREIGSKSSIYVNVLPQPSKNGKTKPCYAYKVNASKSNTLLREIFPYLIVKADKAKQLIDFQPKPRSYWTRYMKRRSNGTFERGRADVPI